MSDSQLEKILTSLLDILALMHNNPERAAEIALVRELLAAANAKTLPFGTGSVEA